jgi:alanine racemase
MDDSYRPTRLEVDLDILIENYTLIRQHVAPRPVMAVLKSNAYGHGLIPVAQALIKKAGCTHIAVAYLDEGIVLREAGIDIPILILGGMIGERIPLFLKHNLSITASSVDKLLAIEAHAKEHNKHAHVHIKIDTGMERIGVHHYSAQELIQTADRIEMLRVEGVFSHFTHADEMNPDPTMKQLASFQDAIQNKSLGMRHIANSGALLQYPQTWLDMVRVGLTLYGISPNPLIPLLKGIKPAMRWVSRIVYFKVIPKGAGVSYGGTWIAPRQTRIVTIPVGYGDGYQRRMSGSAEVLIRGKRYPVVGVICMDQLMVDIGWDEAYNGEEVVLLGYQGKESISINEHAHWASTISYEILCAINARVPRIYTCSD